MSNEIPNEITGYADYIERIKKGLLVDLRKVYPAVESEMEDAVWDAFREDKAGAGYVDFIFYLLQGE